MSEREGGCVRESVCVSVKECPLTTENALNKAAHTTTTVSCELLAAKDMELERWREAKGRLVRRVCVSEESVC